MIQEKIKSLFFSQYALQDILVISPNYPNSICENSLGMIEIMNTDSYLLLRDISQLQNSESLEIGRLYYRQINLSENRVHDQEYIDEGKKIADGLVKRNVLACITTIAVYQYLLRIGILLPFTYLSETNQPITLTPAEIINLGWAKVKSNEQ